MAIFVRPIARSHTKASSLAPLLSPARRLLSGFSSLSPKTLHSVVKLDKFAEESPDKCREIWKAYHYLQPNAAGTTLAKEACDAMMARAKKCSTFVYPVWKTKSNPEKIDQEKEKEKENDGPLDAYLVLLSQFQQPNYFLFTFLEEYRRDPASAQPWMSVAVYPDLLESKGMGLVRADFMPSISKSEASLLMDMLVDSYSTSTTHLEAFNLKPQSFNFDSYIAESKATYLSRLSLTTAASASDQKKID